MNKQKIIEWGLRVSLSLAFLSAVADRFGLWGQAGEAGVVWGNFANFIDYTALLNPWLPATLIGAIAWFATILEIGFGIFLLIPVKTKEVSMGSGVLLSIFALAMLFTVGPKAVLDYSVFTGAFAAFGLSKITA